MSTEHQTFGELARSARTAVGLGLREAAKKMGVSAAYLSRVENHIDPPSADLIVKMSRAYNCPLEKLSAAAKRPAMNPQLVTAINSREHLRILYRIGMEELLTVDELEEFLRSVLRRRCSTEEEVERELARLREELPRIRGSEREDLVASDIKPRYLTKRAIASMAYQILESSGMGPSSYVPPTPIDRLVDEQDGIRYSIANLPSKQRQPIVLGLSRWNLLGEREIVINSVLVENQNGTSEQRFNFTLGHELFHAVEHLPLAKMSAGSSLTRIVLVERDPSIQQRTAAQRAVDRWAKSSKPGVLVTNEDWRE
jgi:transcriptional regulator with XRE-family HTH domain